MASRPNRLCYLLEPLPSLASSKMSRCGVKVWESISSAPVCGRPTCRKGKIDVHGVRTLQAQRGTEEWPLRTILSGVKCCERPPTPLAGSQLDIRQVHKSAPRMVE